MKYKQVKTLKDEEFRRLTGIKKTTFYLMISLLKKTEKEKMKLGGRPSKLSMENRLLMALEYWREYRTYFHVATSYGIAESNCFQTIRWIEDTLIKSGKFSLPGRKELLKSDMDYEVVLVDVTESPIERPKKSKGAITREKRKSTLLKLK
jgi:hypothetical protein